MRILVCGKFHPDSFARCIAVSAEAAGHTVRTFEEEFVRRYLNGSWLTIWRAANRAFPQIERCRQGSLVRQGRDFEPEVILFASAGPQPDVIGQLSKATKAKLAIWYPDSFVNLDRQYMLAAEYDAWFFKDPYIVEAFRAKLGINAHYLPEACQPRWHRRIRLTPQDQDKYGCDITTAGNMYYYRAKMLEAFAGHNFKIWGNSYPRWLNSPLRPLYQNVHVAESEKAKAFNAAKIVLNTLHFGEIEGVNCRLFEAAGCGAVQIADWKPAMPDLFEPEREIVTFHTKAELKQKVDYYLAHDDERQAIADRAFARAHREHTYELRLATMLRILGFQSNVATFPEPLVLQKAE